MEGFDNLPDAGVDNTARTREVPANACIGWLKRGFEDMRRAPAASLFYGGVFSLVGLTLHGLFRHAHEYIAAFGSSFLLVAPFLCIGIYDVSRRLERGEPARLGPTLTAWRPNVAGVALFSAILTIGMLTWMRASLVIFALFSDSEMPSLHGFLSQVISGKNWEFVLAYLAAGGVVAALVFAISAVSIPMMLDRNADTLAAVFTSFAAISRNPTAMSLWAAAIVVLTVLGLVTFYLGLIVVVPLLGHATWHAYRDTVEDQ